MKETCACTCAGVVGRGEGGRGGGETFVGEDLSVLKEAGGSFESKFHSEKGEGRLGSAGELRRSCKVHWYCLPNIFSIVCW